MTFSDFAKMLKPYCGDDDIVSDFVVNLCGAIMEQPKDEKDTKKAMNDEYNPIAKKSISTLEKYYNGGLSLGKRNASVLLKHLDKYKFAEYVNESSQESLASLGNDLCRLNYSIADKEVADVCADIFAAIIEGLAKSTDFMTALKNTNEPFRYEIGSLAQGTPLVSADSDMYLLIEANRICPACGKPLIIEKNGNSIMGYKVIDIIPQTPTGEVKERLGELSKAIGANDLDNKLPLCLDCANAYIAFPTKDECARLLELKSKLQRNNTAVQMMDKMYLEEEIEAVLRGIHGATIEQLSDVLSYNALKIREKIPSSNVPLILKTENWVVHYYNFIKSLFSQLGREIGLDFDNVAGEVRISYKKLQAKNLTQDEIYASFTKWFKDKSKTESVTACEIIVAFFVQNCEVFDEIAK